MIDRIEIKADLAVSDAGAISGIASPFDSADRIGDIVQKGAFQSAKPPIPMLAFHDPRRPVGVWSSLTEKADGLHVVGKLLIDDVPAAREVYALVREGAVRGLSIGFKTMKSITRKGGGRLLQSLDLAEISLVTIPMHPGARVSGIKSGVSAIALADAINRASAALRAR